MSSCQSLFSVSKKHRELLWWCSTCHSNADDGHRWILHSCCHVLVVRVCVALSMCQDLSVKVEGLNLRFERVVALWLCLAGHMFRGEAVHEVKLPPKFRTPHHLRDAKTSATITMTLEDFEKSLAESRNQTEEGGTEGEKRKDKDRSRRHHHHSHHRRSSKYHDDEEGHRHKRSRHSRDEDDDERREKRHKHRSRHDDDKPAEIPAGAERRRPSIGDEATQLKRDSWMEAPSSMDIEYSHRPRKKSPSPPSSKMLQKDFELKLHDNEINRHLHDVNDEDEEPPPLDEDLSAQHEVDYTFGDSGSRWRMTKLKAVYTKAKESGRSVDEVAMDKYGDLRGFDDAREEQIELERRETYGQGYVATEKPSGELFQERKMAPGIRRDQDERKSDVEDDLPQAKVIETLPPDNSTQPLDQTSLNRLKAQMMKAKLRGAADATALEAEYNAAAAGFANRTQPDVVVLGAMESRMLAGGSRAEVKPIDNKRGRERGQVQDNEDMSIEDMVREERRTRGQAGGEGQRFAERIAKDAKFDNDLEYMDENASKLAKRVQKSEINLKNTAIGDFQKMSRILDACPLCHREDTNSPPQAPVVSLATRTFLTLPTEPEISDGGGACIVPVQHRTNLLECDDDEWEEIRNFMKCLIKMYDDQGRDVIFYENASQPHRHKHAAMEAVPLPYSLGETAPAFFKEAILSADEEWTQHKKLIDTLANSKRVGMGRMAFRKSLAKEMPYFHVWFEVDGGLGHVVEDANRWPKGDLFAREVIGGMLDKGPEIVKKQGRWNRNDPRMEGFRKRWRKFDWTSVLADG
jgi:hypothetical protein